MDSSKIVFGLMLAAFAVDALAGLTWWPEYFRIGIPLFVRRQSISQVNPMLPGSKALADRFSGGWVIPLVFRRISPTEIAVRESFWGGFFRIAYTPLVHGILEVDYAAREIRIVGQINAFTLMFTLWFAVWFASRGSADDLGMVLFAGGLLGSILLVQFVRYGNVLYEARRLMESLDEHA